MNVDVLLDTHVVIWLAQDDPRGERMIAPLLDDQSSTISVSSITWTEIAIKSALGKLEVDVSAMRSSAVKLGFLELNLIGGHAEQLALLPHHHRDPFDRILIAQALSEDLQLVSADPQIDAYAVQRFDASA